MSKAKQQVNTYEEKLVEKHILLESGNESLREARSAENAAAVDYETDRYKE